MDRRAGHLSAIATAAALLTAVGCSPYMRYPNFFHPGTAQQQRAEALVHDPYPLDDVGPEIVGGRPLAYQRPVLEVERARDFYSKLPAAGRTPVYTPAPTIQAPPVPYGPAVPVQPTPPGYSPAPLGYSATPQSVTPALQGYVPPPSPQPATTAPTPPPYRY